MDRRSYLTAVGAGLVGSAGCLGKSEKSGQQFETRVVTLTTIDREPREHNIALSGELLIREVTEQQTAKLQLTVTNEGDSESPNIAYVRDEISVIAEDFSYSAPQDYLLVPPEAEQPDRADTCWEVPHEGAFNGSVGGGPTLHLAPNESAIQEYLLWDRKPDTPCMPTGNYHFGSNVQKDGTPFKWMFTLAINESS